MGYFVLTNNPLAASRVAPGTRVVFEEDGIRGLFERAAVLVGQGHALLSHPLAGSVQPGETPYKSIVVSSEAREDIDAQSAKLVSSALEACDKLLAGARAYPDAALLELQQVDLSLLEAALASARVQG